MTSGRLQRIQSSQGSTRQSLSSSLVLKTDSYTLGQLHVLWAVRWDAILFDGANNVLLHAQSINLTAAVLDIFS
jgi:hypothetical protein